MSCPICRTRRSGCSQKAQADYLASFGAEPVNIPLADVYTALQLGRNTEDNLKVVVENGIEATIPAKDAWREPLQEAALDVVLAGWAERAGPEGKTSFNGYLAPIVGYAME
jgi:hypothetical protein